MSDDVKTPTQEQNPEIRTFTQEEVDKLIGARLYAEREKYADYADLKAKAEKLDAVVKSHSEAQAQAEALQAQVASLQKDLDARNARDKISAETGVPANLLTGDTEEACKTQAEAILKWHGQPAKYPTVPDGGEVNPTSGGSTRDKFASWAAQLGK